jgi:LmbE family N-acetylglucosaminyl deacetylase
MIEFSFPGREPLKVLCLGAHSDDIEIGCGGTLLQLTGQRSPVEVDWVIFTSDQGRAAEARSSACFFLAAAARHNVAIHEFRDGFLPYDGASIKAIFENLRETCSPDLIFTHFRRDQHQDHRLISELTWNTFRDHAILEYEIPKYDGDFGQPNVYVSLDERICREKASAIFRAYPSQHNRHWFTEDLFLSVMRIRGMECAAPGRHAEAFYCPKLVLNGR